MDMSLYLSALINVFNVVPAFLLPVFSNGVQFFFQVFDNDVINRFEEADLSQFTGKTVYQILDQHLYALGSPAVYGVELSNGKYTYGSSRIIADVYFSNLPNLAEHPDFMQSMQDFLEEMSISEEHRISHGALAVLEDERHDNKDSGSSVAFLYTTSERKLSDLHHAFSNILQNIPIASFSPATEAATISADIAAEIATEYLQLLSTRMQQTALEKSKSSCIRTFDMWKSIRTEIVENKTCAICRTDNYFLKTHDIFIFRSLIKNPNTSSFALYEKTYPEIPVAQQLKLLDVLFQYTPQDYPPIRKMCRNNWTLWNNLAAALAFSSDYSKVHLLKRYFKKWGIHIDHPKQCANGNRVGGVDECLLELVSSIKENTNVDEFRLFWFEIKALSHNAYAMLAQNYKTNKTLFRLKEDSLSSNDLIDFIISLNHYALGEKVVLIRLNSEEFSHLFDDKLSDWLSDNEDKCAIYDVYHDIVTFYD